MCFFTHQRIHLENCNLKLIVDKQEAIAFISDGNLRSKAHILRTFRKHLHM